jgi:hypothetical protein
MSLRIRFRNVYGEPPQDRADLQILDVRTDSLVDQKINHPTAKAASCASVQAGALYKVKIFPLKHRPVSRLVRVGGSGKAALDVVLAIHPDRVGSVTFPDFDGLDDDLKTVLGRNGVEEKPQNGRDLYEGLAPLQKAGLLNVWTKMASTPLAPDKAASKYVDSLYRVRGDRFFANVGLSFRDFVKTATAGGLFQPADGLLHTPPDGFDAAGSFKTRDGYGNLQLTFFAAASSPLRFKVDADIDDANGVEHVFQVLRNWLTDGETHPYDIHQILIEHQGLDTGYRLRA